VDFGSIVMAFTDKESIVRKYNIIIKKLLVPRLLRLINSILTLFVTDYFTTQMLIGPYTEAILFLVTKLLPITPIILGMP
jgi:hypothetical protein